jgi:hypothetical protein
MKIYSGQLDGMRIEWDESLKYVKLTGWIHDQVQGARVKLGVGECVDA